MTRMCFATPFAALGGQLLGRLGRQVRSYRIVVRAVFREAPELRRVFLTTEVSPSVKPGRLGPRQVGDKELEVRVS